MARAALTLAAAALSVRGSEQESISIIAGEPEWEKTK